VLKWQGGALVPWWMSPSPLNGPAGGWNRNAGGLVGAGVDIFRALDAEGNSQVEIVIANNVDNTTGVLKWDGAALVPIWMSPSPLNGPAGGWNRGADICIFSINRGSSKADSESGCGRTNRSL
jgi:hypothetical protein